MIIFNSKNLKFIMLSFIVFVSACATTNQTKNKEETVFDFFPIQKSCSFVYNLKTEDKKKSDFLVTSKKVSQKASIFSFGTQKKEYVYKKEGIFDKTKGYFILKNPKKFKNWEIASGKAFFITIPKHNKNILIVEERFNKKHYKTRSFYEKNKGLVKYEVFSLENNKEHLLSSMELKTLICSDH